MWGDKMQKIKQQIEEDFDKKIKALEEETNIRKEEKKELLNKVGIIEKYN